MFLRRMRQRPRFDRPRSPRPAHRGGRKTSLAVAMALVLVLAGALASVALAGKAHKTKAHNTVVFSCSAITFNFFDFPNQPNNTVFEKITVDGKTVYEANFVFNGPTASNTVAIHLTPGHHHVDARTRWNTNGSKGGKDAPGKGGLTCGPESAFAIEKLQKFSNTGSFTKETLTVGKVGQTVDYEIVVTNTGNQPLVLSNFEDPGCDPGTITGGPSPPSTPLGFEQSTTYFCDHVLTNADLAAGKYTNTAVVTGTPPEGPPITHESNPVVVELPDPNNSVQFGCTAVTFTFTGFPNLNNNTVSEQITVDGVHVYEGVFTFNGPSASNTVQLTLSPGHHKIDARTRWETNGFKGGRDIPDQGGITCPEPEPAFSIQDKQKIAGGAGEYTTEPIAGEVGQTVDYEIAVTNTGNVPLTFPANSFFDVFVSVELPCTGGPGSTPLAPGETTDYFCEEQLTEAGSFSDQAKDTGDPPEGDGPPITHESNAVVVNVT